MTEKEMNRREESKLKIERHSETHRAFSSLHEFSFISAFAFPFVSCGLDIYHVAFRSIKASVMQATVILIEQN